MSPVARRWGDIPRGLRRQAKALIGNNKEWRRIIQEGGVKFVCIRRSDGVVSLLGAQSIGERQKSGVDEVEKEGCPVEVWRWRGMYGTSSHERLHFHRTGREDVEKSGHTPCVRGKMRQWVRGLLKNMTDIRRK